jgi:flagellin-like protein
MAQTLDERGVSPVVGLVLLLAIVIVGVGVVLVFGATALDDIRNSVQVQSSEHAMREVDSRLSRVAFSENDVEVLDLSETPSRDVSVRNTSRMIITVNETSQCRATIPMGSIVAESEDGEVVAYEGGGVWRESNNGSTMVSPPDFQYEGGTVDFPVVTLENASVGQRRIRVRKNVSASRERTRQIEAALRKPVCQPPGNLTITVESRYYEAWGRYFEQTTDTTAVVDHGNSTAAVTLDRIGARTNVSTQGANLTADTSYVAEITINGTGYHTGGWHLPIAFRVQIEDEGAYTFSPTQGIVDRPLNMSSGHDDVNNPLVAYEHASYPQDTITVPANKTFSVRAISYVCDPGGSSPTDYEGSVMVDTGHTLPEYENYNSGWRRSNDYSERCAAPNLGNREYRNLSSTGNSQYLRVYNHTNNTVSASAFDSASTAQRTPEEVLDKSPITYYPANDTLDLDPNEAVFIYELNEPVGSGDYNDAIVTVSVREQGAIAPSENFALKISTSAVEVSTA